MHAITQAAGTLLLVMLFGICAWGVLSEKWSDNLLQRVGLGSLMLVFFIRWAVASERAAIDVTDVALYACLLIYAVGTITKIARYSKFAPPRPRGRRSWGGVAAAFTRDAKR